MKIPGEMLKLAEHILDSKTDEFDPSEFVDAYEDTVVELLKKKQAGKAVGKKAARPPVSTAGNVIELLKRSLEMSKKNGRKTKAPALVPSMPKARWRPSRARSVATRRAKRRGSSRSKKRSWRSRCSAKASMHAPRQNAGAPRTRPTGGTG